MAALVSKYSLVEQVKRIDPDGTLSMIVEILDREIPIFSDAPFFPTNDTWSHKSTRRGTIPGGTWRKMNVGVAAEVARTTEQIDNLGMLETYADYDKEYIDTSPEPMRARMDEAAVFIEGLAQTFASAMLYSDAAANPDQIMGIAPRLNTIDGKFVLGNGGTGNDLTSIYVVTWGRAQTFVGFPKNAAATLGIIHEDLGRVTLQDANSLNYEGYRDWFQIKAGLVNKDPRTLGRIANIETAGASNLFDEDLLIKLMNKMKTGPGTRIYVNETILTQMEIALKDKNNVNYTADAGEGLAGERILRFRGFPVRKIDSEILLDTESAITT